MKELFEQIVTEFETFKANAQKQIETGNKSAGARARKASNAIDKLTKQFRKASVEASKAEK